VVIYGEVKSGLRTGFSSPSVSYFPVLLQNTTEGSRWRERGLGGLCLPPTDITECSRCWLPIHPRSSATTEGETRLHSPHPSL